MGYLISRYRKKIRDIKNSITKHDLIGRLSKKFHELPLSDVKLAVDIMLDHITQALVDGERAEFRGFGSFSLHYLPPRRSRNPATGEEIVTPGRYRPHFKPGKELRKCVNKK